MIEAPSPFASGGDMENLRRHHQEEMKLREKMAYEQMVSSGKEWIQKHGEDGLKTEIEKLRIDLRAWNSVCGSTIPLTLTTIDAMMQAVSILPVVTGQIGLVSSPKYIEFCVRLSAIRNYLIEQKNKVIEKHGSGLSTPIDNTMK